MNKYYLWSIGCQMNAADSRRAAEMLDNLGFVSVSRAEDADLIILNTCVVRQSAEDKVAGRLSSLKSVKRRRPGVSIAVMGCLVGDVAALREQYPYVDAFLFPSDIDGLRLCALSLVQSVDALFCSDDSSRPPAPTATEVATTKDGALPCSEGFPPSSVSTATEVATAKPRVHPVSALVPIMHGCDHHCTYCIVRLRRGPGRSLPVAAIVEETRRAVASGAREVTLLGQNVDAYGHDLSERPALVDLLHAVHDIEGLVRIRFLTSHPAEVTDRLIDTVAELPKVCEHFEVPVQAGDDGVLKRMGRGYTVARYRDLIARIRAQIPGVSIATDVIVGFPGETAEQFQATMALLCDLRFDAVHVAAYSPRPGTPAYLLPDDVPAEEKEARRQTVEDLQEQVVREINAHLLGRTVEILVEGKSRGKWGGRTRTNKLVFFEDGGDWQGKLVTMRIVWAGPWSLRGELPR